MVTFEPDQNDFLKNLKINLNTFGSVFIVDNSTTDESITFLSSLVSLPSVHIIQNKANCGIAFAQNIGIKIFLESNFEYVIHFDQDSSIDLDSATLLYNFYATFKNHLNLGGVGPVSLDQQFKEVTELKSSGLLSSKQIYLKNGLMNSDLFIDFVDYEWCWRASYFSKFKFFQIPCKYTHQLGVTYKLFNFIDISIPSPFRHKYQFRNSMFLSFTPFMPIKWKLRVLPVILLKIILYPLALPDGLIRLKFMLVGIYDFFKFKFFKRS